MLKAGIVGLPNVGKSTLFNAVTRTRKAEAANYPFCTIDPNVGIVTVPDARLAVLKDIAKTQVIIPAAIEFVDIAGLVKGAATGRRPGQQIPQPHPRSRCHRAGRALFRGRGHSSRRGHHRSGARHRNDHDGTGPRRPGSGEEASGERRRKDAKRGDKVALAEQAVLQKLQPHLNAGKPALTRNSPRKRKSSRAASFC